MGTSSSSGGPTGKTPLLPNWATNGGVSGPQEGNNPSESEGASGDDSDEIDSSSKAPSDSPATNADYTDNWASAKTSFSKFVSGKSGSGLRQAAGSYVKSMGGSSKAIKAASKGITVGGGYIDFLGDIKKKGLEQTLQEYGLSDCLGKSSEEALAKIAEKIAPIGTTNDEIIARGAVMLALDKLCEKLLEKGVGIEALESLSEDTLKESVTEYVSAYIFKKWIYELGLALERNDLSEREAIDLEKQVRTFIRDEVKTSLKNKDIIKLDFQKGTGKKIIEDIFALAYSTLEK